MALRAVIGHPKFAHLKGILKLPKAVLLGYLEATWHFTAAYAPQGNIGRFTDQQIEAWMEWDGEPGVLVAALTEAKWLDADQEHRLLVHDWHEHADKAVKQSLKNKKLGFFVPSVRPVGGQNAGFDEKTGNLFQVCAPPEAGAGAEPEAGAGAGPGATAPLPPIPPTAGNGGEFMAATWLGEELRLALSPGDVRILAEVIRLESRDRSGDVVQTAEWIRDMALEARSRGEPVTVWWIKDRKFTRYAEKFSLELEE